MTVLNDPGRSGRPPPLLATSRLTLAHAELSLRRDRRNAVMLLFLAAFFWGAGNVANKTVLEHVDPVTAVMMRCLFAVLVLLPFVSRDPIPPPTTAGPNTSLFFVSLLFAVALVLQQFAFGLTTVTNASFLVNTAGPLTPLIVWLALRAPPARVHFLSAGIMIVGIYLMSGGHFSPTRMNPGDLACLASAVFYAAWMVALGQHARQYGRPIRTTCLQFAVTVAVLLPIVLTVDLPNWTDLRAALPELLLLGIFSTGIAFLLQCHAQSRVTAPTAALLVSAESLFGAAVAFLLLGERLDGKGLAGAALILLAISLAAFSNDRR